MVREMCKAYLSSYISTLYRCRIFRKICILFLDKFEGGPFYSITWREILVRYHGVRVGAYSYGQCMEPGAWPSGVGVGRFVSIGSEVKVFLRNHPVERISMHPFFYNHHLGYVDTDNIESGILQIGHDTWVGSRVAFLPGCQKVGIGAVIGACSVVTKDVPNFAVVGGNPARIIRYRFSEKEQENILASCWWEKSISDITLNMECMTIPFNQIPSSHPLLQRILTG